MPKFSFSLYTKSSSFSLQTKQYFISETLVTKTQACCFRNTVSGAGTSATLAGEETTTFAFCNILFLEAGTQLLSSVSSVKMVSTPYADA